MKRFAVVLPLVSLFACGVAESEITVPESELDDGAAELSIYSRTYVTVRRDFRKCSWPMCGGYFVQDVNRVHPNEVYVASLDFSSSKLPQSAIDQALGGDAAELVLHGKLGPQLKGFPQRSFVVSSAWRGMPGVTPVAGETFFRVVAEPKNCLVAPCPQHNVVKLNGSAKTGVVGFIVERASQMLVDQKWLVDRLENHGALVAAKVVDGKKQAGGVEKLADASQVYVKLPEAPGPCPQFKLAACPEGQVRNYSRNENRCVMPGACIVPQGACAQLVPNCAEGYTMQSWPSDGPFACTGFACDPTWSLPAAE